MRPAIASIFPYQGDVSVLPHGQWVCRLQQLSRRATDSQRINWGCARQGLTISSDHLARSNDVWSSQVTPKPNRQREHTSPLLAFLLLGSEAGENAKSACKTCIRWPRQQNEDAEVVLLHWGFKAMRGARKCAPI